MYNAKAYSAASATSPLASATFPRRDSTERDVQLEILFCGICHSDLHQVRNEWRDVMPTVYPCVPGTRSWAVARFNEVERIRFRRDPSERSLLETLIRKGSSPAHRLLNADLVEGGRL